MKTNGSRPVIGDWFCPILRAPERTSRRSKRITSHPHEGHITRATSRDPLGKGAERVCLKRRWSWVKPSKNVGRNARRTGRAYGGRPVGLVRCWGFRLLGVSPPHVPDRSGHAVMYSRHASSAGQVAHPWAAATASAWLSEIHKSDCRPLHGTSSPWSLSRSMWPVQAI